MNKKIGQANHFIITILIGLDEIIMHNSKKSDGFRTTWNPQDKKASVVRSRDYALKSSVALAIDSLEYYLEEYNIFFSTITKLKDPLFNDYNYNIESKIECFYRTLNDKVESDFFKIYVAMIQMFISWKNGIIQCSAKNSLDLKYEKTLINNQEKINKSFCGLDIFRTIESFKSNNSPTMKEVTAFIRSIHGFAQILDAFILNCDLHLQNYALFVINDYFNKFEKQKKAFLSLSKDRQYRKLKTLLVNNGFSEVEDKLNSTKPKITDDFLKNYVSNFCIG
jgi:hypothetical protein